MLCYVYRSKKQDEMYLYLPKMDDFSAVPEALLRKFGGAEKVMELDLSSRQTLARASIDNVKQALQQQGFYLQMPPTVHVMLHQGDGL